MKRQTNTKRIAVAALALALAAAPAAGLALDGGTTVTPDGGVVAVFQGGGGTGGP